MKSWWQNLSSREQLIVMCGGAAGILILLYLMIWSPMQNHIQDMQKKTIQQVTLLSWMQGASKDLQQLRQSSKPKGNLATPENLLALVDQSAKDNKLKTSMAEFTQTENNKVSIKFNLVSFDKLVTWLTALWNEHHVEVSDMTTTSKGGEGMVQAQVTLEAGG